MTNVKPTLPREVADAIESMREDGQNNFNIMRLAHGSVFEGPSTVIKRYFFESDIGISPDTLMSALINGYEVEQTPEDRVLEYYNRIIRRAVSTNSPEMFRLLGEKEGITKTLNTLGIKIEGVNA